MQVALVGITGYAGSILHQLLGQHPNVDGINLYQHDLERKTTLAELSDNFDQDSSVVYPYDSQSIINHNQVVFFATPSGVTSKLSSIFLDQNFPVIDLSGDLRLNDPHQYEKWYQKVPADDKAMQKADYSLPDLDHEISSQYIANPGCYATATLLGLAPLVKDDLIDLNSIVIDAKSGLSGSGKKLTDSSHFVNANENVQIYKPNQHKHIPEMMMKLKDWNPKIDSIQFMTSIIPVNRGIMSNIYAKVNSNVNETKIQDKFTKLANESPFIKFNPDRLPDLKSAVGTNDCYLGIEFNEKTQVIMVTSVIDNMLKGAAGQAIQNFNQLFNYPDTAGLKLKKSLI